MRWLRWTGIVLACFGVLVVAPAPAAERISPRIVGGAPAPLSEHPWQVAILYGTPGNREFLCGGVILDTTHVLTAAHCLVNGAGNPEPASKVWVLAGVTDLAAPIIPGEQLIGATSVQPMPGYGTPPATEANDAGLIELADPLVRGPAVQPAVLTPAGAATPAGTPLTVSGWGVTEFGQVSAALRAVDIAAVSDAACSLQYDVDFDPGTMLCAIGPGKDACFGDSGGPLTRQDRVLTGLVSWGPESCGGAEGPGVYTELADADINAFARFSGYAPPQNSGAPPAFEGAPQAGEPVSCAPGGWTGGPDFDYRFEQDGPLRVLARDWSSSPSFTPTGAEVGRKLRCLVRARGDGGAAIVTSEASAAVLEGAPTLTSATADPATAGRGQSVTLSATAADPDSAQDELLYTWDLEGDGFGPGDPTGATVTTSFATAGDKTVPVRVTDEGGRADTGQATLTVVAEVAPQITALSVPATARRLTEVTLSATVTAGTTPADQLRFLWDLDGDGAYDDAATGSTPSVTTTLDGPTGPRTVGVEVRDRTAPIELFERARRTLEVLPASTVPLAPPAGGDPPARASDATPPALRITRVRRSGTRALVTVACPGEPCAGTLTLRTAGKVRTGSGRRVLVVGRAPFRITGAARVVRVRLSSGARRLLRRGSLRVVASAQARDDAGNTASRTARGTLRRG